MFINGVRRAACHLRFNPAILEGAGEMEAAIVEATMFQMILILFE